MQYWINHNGVQSGPVDLDGLKEMGLTSAAYVWHEGLADWVKITQLPELQGLYEFVGDPIAPQVSSAEPQPAAVGEPLQEADGTSGSETVAGDNPVAEPAPEPAVTGQPYQPYQPQPEQYGYGQQPQYQQPQYAQPQPDSAEPCPPTNLVWAIISTVLCCLPAGVVAIVYAVKVMNKYRDGDMDGAKRASETGAWWCIASIILGIIFQPIMSFLPLMMGSMN